VRHDQFAHEEAEKADHLRHLAGVVGELFYVAHGGRQDHITEYNTDHQIGAAELAGDGDPDQRQDDVPGQGIHARPPSTASIYSDGFSNCPAARSASSNTGCANRPTHRVSAARPAMVRYSGTRVPVCGGVRWASAGCAFQNTSAQILIIEYSVSSPNSSAVATSHPLPVSTPARMTMYLAKKPDSGGSPASDSAGIRNRIASSGFSRYSPPSCFRS